MSDPDPPRILYIDDYPLDRQLVRDALEQESSGFQVIEAASREEFEARLAEGDYDLVLTDLNIHGFEGLQVLDRVQALYPDLPVVIVTGTGTEAVAVEAMKRGAADYVIKSPTGIRRLPHVIREVLEKKRLREERQQAQEALRESEQHYRRIVETAQEGIWTIDAKANTTFVNQKMADMLGYTVEEMASAPLLDFMDDEGRAEAARLLDRRRQGIAEQHEFRFRRKDGSDLWTLLSTVPYFDDAGCYAGALAMVADLTERKAAEEALRESEQRFRTLFDNVSVGMALVDMQGQVLAVNEADCRFLGYPCDELVGMHFAEFTHPEDLASDLELFNDLLDGKRESYSIDKRYVRKNEEVVWGRLSVALIRDELGHPLYTIVVCEDITARKQVEQALRQSEERYRGLFNSVPTGLYRSEAGRFLAVNPALVAMLGYPDSETLLSTPPYALFADPEERARLGQAIREDRGARGLELRLRRYDGTPLWAESHAHAICDDDGQVLFYEGALQDITERKRVEEALRESEARYRGLVTNIPIGVYRNTPGPSGEFLAANPTFLDMFGLSSEQELAHLHPADFYADPSERKTFSDNLLTQGSVRGVELRLKKRDGTLLWGAVTARVVYDERAEVAFFDCAVEDITERKRAEEALRESQATLQSVFRAAPIGIGLLTNRMFDWINDAFVDMVGYSREELIGQSTRIIYESDEEYERVGWEKYGQMPETAIGTVETRLRHKDGAAIEVLLSSARLEPGDRASPVIFTALDITARKRAEGALRESERTLATLMSNLPGMAYRCRNDRQWTMEFVSEGCLDLTGYSPADLIQSRTVAYIDLIHPEDRHVDWDDVQEAVQTDAPFEFTYRILTAMGDEKWVWERGRGVRAPDGDRVVLEGFIDDITERVRAEEAEREQRALAEALRDTAAAISSTLDFDQVMRRILENVDRVVPHDAANIMLLEGQAARVTYWSGYPPEYDDFFKSHRFSLGLSSLRKMLAAGEASLLPDTALAPDWEPLPETAWVRSWVGAPIRVRDAVIGFLNLDSGTPGFFTPAHAEHLQAFADQAAVAVENAHLYDEVRGYAAQLEQRVGERTAELDRERAQLQTILDSMVEAVLYIEGASDVQYSNRAFSALLGYGLDELRRDPSRIHQVIFAPVPDYEALTEEMRRTVMEGRTWQGDVRLQRKDGSEFDAAVAVSPVHSPDGDLVGRVMLIRDISREKALQQQREQFVANASHELRTPVTTLGLRLYLLDKQPHELKRHLPVLGHEYERLKRLVDNLLNLSRFERGVIQLNRQEVILNDLVEEVRVGQEDYARQKSVALTFDLPEEPIQVHVDPDRILQVITNLVVNAINYTPSDQPGGGRVTVQLARADRAEALIQVRDNGVGIAANDLPRLFEPFFRANPDVGEGSGLGLSIAKEIIELHGGAITVESEEGAGSTFTVRLPL